MRLTLALLLLAAGLWLTLGRFLKSHPPVVVGWTEQVRR